MLQTVLYFVLLAALLAAFLFLSRRRQTKRFGVILLTAVFAFELLVANFHSYHLWFGGYEETEITLDGTAQNISITGKAGAETHVEIKEIDRRVGTIRVEVKLPEVTDESLGTPYADVRVDAMDETQQGYYRSSIAEGRVVRGADRTAYLVLDLSGKVSDLRIHVTPKKDCAVELTALTLNAPIPMQFSMLRLLLPVGILTALYLLLTHPAMLAPYGERRVLCGRIVLAATGVLMLCAVALTFLYQYDRSGGISEGFALTYGNQISKELVDAFSAGQVSLLQTPPKELLELDNPYDWSERSSKGISYLWDHLLYDGKYYSYYGIAPVLLLFLPYHLLTGYYFPTPEAVLLFGALGILFLSLLYLAFCNLFAKRVPVNMVLSGLLICQLSSGVWYNFCSPLFYEIAQASGFCFTCMGFYFLLRSGVVGDSPICLPSLTAAGVCLSLAVLSRPTLALYCVAALILLFFGLRKYRGQVSLRYPSEPKKRRGAIAKYLICALSGFVILGGLQMLYNYARFDSFFDFGIQYSLTINDFTRAEYHTDLATIGFYNFLFAFPQVRPEFPYVFSNFSDLGVNGYYFIANTNAIGILWRALPSLGLLLAPSAFRALRREERLPATLSILSICLAVPLGIIFSIWESGYGVRYCADFAWQLILGGISVFYLLYVRRAQRQTKQILRGFFVGALAVALICNFGMIYSYMSRSGYLESGFLAFERLFDFWK